MREGARFEPALALAKRPSSKSSMYHRLLKRLKSVPEVIKVGLVGKRVCKLSGEIEAEKGRGSAVKGTVVQYIKEKDARPYVFMVNWDDGCYEAMHFDELLQHLFP